MGLVAFLENQMRNGNEMHEMETVVVQGGM